jgi:hypothetical protein
MDQISLVNKRVEDGQALIFQLMRDGVDVVAAYWVNAPDDHWWYLFIASRLVDRIGPEAYKHLQRSLERLPGTSVSLSDVKLIGGHNPYVTDVQRLLRASGGEPVTLRNSQLGNLAVEEAYIYPPLPESIPVPPPLGKRRLKSEVRARGGIEDTTAPLSPTELRAKAQIIVSGAISSSDADYWVRKRREEMQKAVIPAGSVVDARIAAWWGSSPKDDPNPLLLVTATNGAEGLTFLSNTEPVN